MPVRPLVAAVGGDRPSAVITLRGLDPDRPSRTVCELVLLAAAFRRWRRVGHRAVFWPAAVRRWETVDGLEAGVARAVIAQRPASPEPAVLHALLVRSAAAGHRVRLAAGHGTLGAR